MGKRVPAWTSASPLFEHQNSSIDIEVDQVVPMVSEVLESLRRALSTPLALWADIKERRVQVFRGQRKKGQRNRRDFVGPKNGVEVNHPKIY
jgi:hypothetical protein